MNTTTTSVTPAFMRILASSHMTAIIESASGNSFLVVSRPGFTVAVDEKTGKTFRGDEVDTNENGRFLLFDTDTPIDGDDSPVSAMPLCIERVTRVDILTN